MFRITFAEIVTSPAMLDEEFIKTSDAKIIKGEGAMGMGKL